MKKKVIIIAGPTATGKSDVAIELAQKLNGEIISADSMCVYKYMDIGTAKPSIDQRNLVKHYLIDIVFPNEDYNVAKFQKDATLAIDEIYEKNKIPIIVGGTGFYIKSLMDMTKFPETSTDPRLREYLYNLANDMGNNYVYQMLQKIDEVAARNVHPNNLKRVIRYIEIYEQTKRKPSEFLDQIKNCQNQAFDFKAICFQIDRQLLYQRINLRVDKMISAGLIDEVEKLLNMGYSKELKSMQGLGYKQIIPYLEGKLSKEDAIDELKLRTRQFAKRQIIWFKYQGEFNYLDITNLDFSNLVKKCFDICKSVV
ncbi:tRNA (adenosine(37)-N6)-dimethylallyltransferase MiaA [Caldicellulosiruptoraceae bacterium PP1]